MSEESKQAHPTATRARPPPAPARRGRLRRLPCFRQGLDRLPAPHGLSPHGPVSAGKVADLKKGTLQIYSSNVVVGLDNQGVYAMSAVCTHAGCLVEDTSGTISDGLSCPCHGSTFDGNGAVTRGPARTPLQHYQVTIAADGSITVDGSKPVAADVRVRHVLSGDPLPTGVRC